MNSRSFFLFCFLLVCLFHFTDETCNNFCSNNNECGGSDNCSYCNPTNNQCTVGKDCGAECIDDTDCNQLTCYQCLNNVCVTPGFCDSYCEQDSDCSTIYCRSCFNNTCQTGCGSSCFQDNQCVEESCPFCVLGGGGNVCRGDETCGGLCFIDSDCTANSTNTNCTNCIDNFCRSSCNSNCTSDTDCVDTGCSYCDPNSKTCSPGPCGAPCQNNNGCNGFEGCSRCDLNNNTCVEGLPCGSSCEVDSDCNESTCPICEKIYYGKPGVCVDESSCGSSCTTDYECYDYNPACGSCFQSSGKVACDGNDDCNCQPSLCGGYCRYGDNNSCDGSDYCTKCVQITTPINYYIGTCQKGGPCGSVCYNDLDCDQSPSSSCPFCMDGKCSS